MSSIFATLIMIHSWSCKIKKKFMVRLSDVVGTTETHQLVHVQASLSPFMNILKPFQRFGMPLEVCNYMSRHNSFRTKSVLCCL